VSGRDQGTPIPDHEGPLPGKVITGDEQEGLIEPGDRPRAADRFGTTVDEQRAGAPLDERLRWEQPDVDDVAIAAVEAEEFDRVVEVDVDPYDLDQGALDREHPAPIVAVEGASVADESDVESLGPAPDGFGAATRAATARDHDLERMSDEELHGLVDALVDEREQMLQRADHDGSARLDIELDVLWDLLRQRRALREAGGDPSEARPRPIAIVEGYEQ